jgi:hypothetical protein
MMVWFINLTICETDELLNIHRAARAEGDERSPQARQW